MVRFTVLVFTLVLLLLPSSEGAVAQEPPRLPRVFVESSIDHPIALGIARSLGRTRPVPFGSRVLVTRVEESDALLDQYVSALTDADVPVWLALEAPASVEQVDDWRLAIRALLARHVGRIAIFEVIYGDQPESLRRFVLQVASTEARGSARTTRVAASGRDGLITEQILAGLTRDTAPYVDLMVLPRDVEPDASQRLATVAPDVRWMRRDQESGDAMAAKQRIVRDVLMTVGTAGLGSAWKGDADAIAGAIRALAPASDLLTHEVTPMDVAAADFALRQAGRDAQGTMVSRLLFDDETFATYLVYESDSSLPPVEATLRLAVDGRPVLVDLVAGEVKPLSGFTRDAASSLARAVLPSTGRPMLVNFSQGAEVQFVDRTGVAAVRELAVEEIIARHREHQVRQDALLRHYRASVVMEQHFRPSLTDPGYDVVTENEYFFDKEGVEWEERSFTVNGSRWDVNRPPFPLLQPEKVLSLPLELRLDEDYRYQLDGSERVDGIDCYRVHFAPTRADAALYRGTVWIDRQTFARRRLRAVQTRTSAPVVSNEEIHTYAPVAEVEGVSLLLLTRLTARQIVLIAGRNLLLEKAATFSHFRVNDSTFFESREQARQGPRVMYRDTERGVRYFLKEGEQRVVSERATASARAMAMGVLVDPSFAFPLPIFGINYLDFEFRGRSDTQFALLFGGVLAAGNLQRPRLAGTDLDASIDFFGIAAPASDRLYGQDGERASEALLTWPLSTGVNLGWQYTPFQKAQLQYQVRFDPFVRDRTTDESFVVPSSTVTQGLGGAWEFKRAGYSLAANGTYFFRASWKPWGPIDALESDPPRTYAKYAVHLTRDFFVDAFQKVHLNASYFGGNRLDRFSRYQFGMFDDTRIHGVPASGVRFDNLGMIRASYSFNIFEQYRLDVFAEQAWGQDRTIDRAWQPLTGLGFAVNLRAPWNTILRADVGKSLLPDRYSGAGSTVLQVMLLKPLGGG